MSGKILKETQQKNKHEGKDWSIGLHLKLSSLYQLREWKGSSQNGGRYLEYKKPK